MLEFHAQCMQFGSSTADTVYDNSFWPDQIVYKLFSLFTEIKMPHLNVL